LRAAFAEARVRSLDAHRNEQRMEALATSGSQRDLEMARDAWLAAQRAESRALSALRACEVRGVADAAMTRDAGCTPGEREARSVAAARAAALQIAAAHDAARARVLYEQGESLADLQAAEDAFRAAVAEAVRRRAALAECGPAGDVTME
jgi:hypothetical protein